MEDKVASQKSEILKVTVSGKKFVLNVNDILMFPNSTLARVLKSAKSSTRSFTFTRPVSSFKSICTLYQTGQLHMPFNVCPKEFENELRFWNIPHSQMEVCCSNRYTKLIDEMFRMNDVRSQFSAEEETQTHEHETIRGKIWKVLDLQSSSVLAKVYLFIAVSFVILSLLTLSISTMEQGKTRPSKEDIRDLVHYTGNNDDFKIIENYLDLLPEDDFYYLDYNMPENNSTTGHENSTIYTEWKEIYFKFGLGDLKRKSSILSVIDYIILGFFTVELILRLITCPSVLQYYKSVLNILDTLAVILPYIEILINEVKVDERFNFKGYEILVHLQMLRIFRILRIVRNVTSIKILVYSLKRSYDEFLVLFLYVWIAMTLYGTAFYFTEDENHIRDIPEAYWLSVITMTTVGYGDMYPRSAIGRFVGAFCALTGVLLLALVIPLFVSTFVNASEYVKCQKRIKESNVGDQQKPYMDENL